MTENFYAAPEADLNIQEETDGVSLASRWARLGAAILDSIIMILIFGAVFIPLGIVLAFTAPDNPQVGNSMEDFFLSIAAMGPMEQLLFNLISTVIGVFVYIIVNGYFLAKSGQTLGKKIMGIKVVRYANRTENPGFGNLVGLRYLVPTLMGYIPFVGGFFPLINILFIFGREKRCVHDHIAGTVVVDAK